MFFKKVPSISASELKTISNPNIIDVRTPAEFNQRKLKGARNIEMNKLMATPETFLDKNKVYYLYCASGMRSKTTCKTLIKKGYQVVNMGSINKFL